MRLVDLETLNRLRYPDNPIGVNKLRRWCREGELPAHKRGKEWFVDLDTFDREAATGTVDRFRDAMMLHLQGNAA